MSNNKTYVVSIRVSESTKKALEQKAEENVTDLSQYVKYVLLSSIEEEGRNTKRYKCLDWLEKNYRLIGRMIIDGYCKTDVMAKCQLDKECLKSVNEVTHKIFEKQGIPKKEGERYY